MTNQLQQATDVAAKGEAVERFIMHHLGDADNLVFPYFNISLPHFVSRHSLMLVLSAVLLLIVVTLAARTRRDGAAPTGAGNLLEAFVGFIRNRIAIPVLGETDGVRMTPLFCTFFFFILTTNLVGLVPCFYTATANLSVTAALACVTFGVMTIGAMWRKGVLMFFKGLVPEGLPWPIGILLFPIELLALFVRTLALTIRLFANELAGHMVLLFMVGLIAMFGYVALPAILLAIAVLFLEIGIAFLQAFIFTLFSAVFIGATWQQEQ